MSEEQFEKLDGETEKVEHHRLDLGIPMNETSHNKAFRDAKSKGENFTSFSHNMKAAPLELVDVATGEKFYDAGDKLALKPETSDYSPIVEGRRYTAEELLELDSPIGDALRSGESPKLLEAIERMKTCPWKPAVIFRHPVPQGFSDYDPGKSAIYIDPTWKPDDQILRFAHESFHSTHQSITKLYSGEKPVDPQTFYADRINAEIESFKQEIKVRQELGLPSPVTFDYIAPDGRRVTQNLEDLAAKDEKFSTYELAIFLYRAQPVDGIPYDHHYWMKTVAYQDASNYQATKRNLVSLWNRIVDWESRNP